RSGAPVGVCEPCCGFRKLLGPRMDRQRHAPCTEFGRGLEPLGHRRWATIENNPDGLRVTRIATPPQSLDDFAGSLGGPILTQALFASDALDPDTEDPNRAQFLAIARVLRADGCIAPFGLLMCHERRQRGSLELWVF